MSATEDDDLPPEYREDIGDPEVDAKRTQTEPAPPLVDDVPPVLRNTIEVRKSAIATPAEIEMTRAVMRTFDARMIRLAHEAGEKIDRAETLRRFDLAVALLKTIPFPPEIDTPLDIALELARGAVHKIVDEEW